MRRRTRFIVAVLVLLIIVAVAVHLRARGPTIKPGSYLVLDLHGDYQEGPPSDVLGRLLRRRETTLYDLLALIRMAQTDQRITGMICKISPLEIGWGKLEDIRDALAQFRSAGKPVIALIEQEMFGSNKEYYVASAADRIYLSPSLTAPLTGLASEFIFLGGVWEKLDIQMDVEKVREYKTFGDMIANKEMTPAHREMANAILDSLNGQFIAALAQGRNTDPGAVQALIDQCPVSPDDFAAAHFCDGVKHLEDVHDELGGERTPFVERKDYAQVDETSLGLNIGPKVAVVYAVGAIIPGESGTSIQGQVMGADTIAQALHDAADDADVHAIIFRVDSPGGSALASDLIWRATQEARKKKPLIVSMSDVAGSGGYYIATGGTRILAQPGTLTGSIGVVVTRPNIHDFLSRLGINTQSITRGRFADLENITTPLTPEGRDKLIAAMNHIYDVFVSRVAAGRRLTPEQVNDIGRGRVWTGAQAKENGLIDELGGLRAAVQAAKQAAGLEPSKEVQLVFYPHPKGVLERLSEMLGGNTNVQLPPLVQQALRALPWQFPDGAVLTLMPERIEVH